MKSFLYRFLAVVLFPAVSFAAQPSPYVGQQSRDIKTLSEQEVSDYLAGKGMGFAKAGELNGYPGPAHVLELAQELTLSADQRRQTESLFKKMQARAATAGAEFIEAERALNKLFASKAATASSLREAVQRAADAQMQVRMAHLEAHLAQLSILSPAQVQKYIALRGYTDAAPQSPHRHSH